MIVYDISDNNTRYIIAEILKNYGLKRIQESVFLGTLKIYSLNSLLTDISSLIITDSLVVLSICDRDFKNIITIGKKMCAIENVEKEIEFC
jgi:CRISPR-associated endonuclease Cas2